MSISLVIGLALGATTFAFVDKAVSLTAAEYVAKERENEAKGSIRVAKPFFLDGSTLLNVDKSKIFQLFYPKPDGSMLELTSAYLNSTNELPMTVQEFLESTLGITSEFRLIGYYK